MKKLLCFDLDGTLISVLSWAKINTLLGISDEEDAELFEKYIKGNLEYATWTKQLVSLYKRGNPVTKQQLLDLANTLPLRDDAIQAVEDAKAKGYETLIVSGSVDIVVEAIAKKVNADAWLACNKAVFNEREELADIVSLGDEAPSKLDLLTAYCNSNEISLENVIAVGDGGNDKKIFELVKGIMLGESADLRDIAWKKVETLSEVKNLI